MRIIIKLKNFGDVRNANKYIGKGISLKMRKKDLEICDKNTTIEIIYMNKILFC
jgi:ribosomal protein L35AE/L33A